MYQSRTFLAIIPARSGSKRLPNKNIKELCGKPLMAWSIEVGLKSKCIDTVMVNTDSLEYAQIAKSYGAEIPFLRPQELGGDMSNSFDVIYHTIDFYKNQLSQQFDYIVFLQPTSPFRDTQLVDNMCKWVVDNNIDSCVSVSLCEHPPLWSNTLPEDKNMKDFLSQDVLGKRSQDLPKYYRINGVLYIAKITHLIENKGFMSPETYAYEIPQKYAVDIDTELDFEYAEFILKKYMEKN